MQKKGGRNTRARFGMIDRRDRVFTAAGLGAKDAVERRARVHGGAGHGAGPLRSCENSPEKGAVTQRRETNRVIPSCDLRLRPKN